MVLDRVVGVVRVRATVVFSFFVAYFVVFHLFVEKYLVGDVVVILIDEGQVGDDIPVVDYSQRLRNVFLYVIGQFDIPDPWGSVGVQFGDRFLLGVKFDGCDSGKCASQAGPSHDDLLSQIGISQHFVCNFNAGGN